MGIDPGSKRVGVALSDLGHMIASPYGVLEAGEAVEQIGRLVRDEEVEAIVIGLPVSLAGHEGPSAEAARAFGDRVAEETGMPIQYVDERFTTKIAEGAMLEGGMRRRRRRDIRDKMAATVMLQGHLDSRA